MKNSHDRRPAKIGSASLSFGGWGDYEVWAAHGFTPKPNSDPAHAPEPQVEAVEEAGEDTGERDARPGKAAGGARPATGRGKRGGKAAGAGAGGTTRADERDSGTATRTGKGGRGSGAAATGTGTTAGAARGKRGTRPEKAAGATASSAGGQDAGRGSASGDAAHRPGKSARDPGPRPTGRSVPARTGERGTGTHRTGPAEPAHADRDPGPGDATRERGPRRDEQTGPGETGERGPRRAERTEPARGRDTGAERSEAVHETRPGKPLDPAEDDRTRGRRAASLGTHPIPALDEHTTRERPRPYVRGSTPPPPRARHVLPPEVMLFATGRHRGAAGLDPDLTALCRMCQIPTSIAEVSAYLRQSLDATRDLVQHGIDLGLLVADVAELGIAGRPPLALLHRVHQGLLRL